MYFTQEDYRKIERWLTSKSIKDSDFQEALELDGSESVAIVQNGFNRQINVKRLINELLNIGINDFINVTDNYNARNITLSEAISIIPYKGRKLGQVITFLNKKGMWEIYQFIGTLNQWGIVDAWKPLLGVIKSVLPDNEDLALSEPDKDGNTYISIKDRDYAPNSFSGMGRTILRKNLVDMDDSVYGENMINMLTQEMVAYPNTVYEIRYDFNLNGETITIPENCVLDYQGGSLNNGKLIYNDTFVLGIVNINNISTDGNIKHLYNPIISGNTLDRPNNVTIGFQYFDTDLNVPIWWTGTNWVTANGDSV